VELEGMNTNVDACWVRKERKFPAANNALNLYGRLFFKRLIYCSEMYKCLHEFSLKLFQIPVYVRLLT